MSTVSMKQLLEAGVHFGHQTRRWNPKMKKYIFDSRNGIYIIDLQKTSRLLDEAYDFVREAVGGGGEVLFVGTKKQAQETIRDEAERCGMHYVNQRWLGGTMTNFRTISLQITKLKQLDEMKEASYQGMTKKEGLVLDKKREKLVKYLFGIRNMERLPAALFVIDPKKERIAVLEANRLQIPIVGVVDTNCDPDDITYVIPSNDDAIRAIKLLTSKIADAALEGRRKWDESLQTTQAAAEAEAEAAAEAAKSTTAESIKVTVEDMVEAPQAEAEAEKPAAKTDKAPKAKAAPEPAAEKPAAKTDKAPKAKAAPEPAAEKPAAKTDKAPKAKAAPEPAAEKPAAKPAKKAAKSAAKAPAAKAKTAKTTAKKEKAAEEKKKA